MGSVQKRPNGRYRGRVVLPGGKEKTRSFLKQTDAARWVTSEQAKADRGDWIDPAAAKQTFGSYALEWQELQVQHRRSTAEVTDSRLRNHVLPTFGERPLGAVRRSEVRAWVTALSLELKPATVEVCYRLLAQVFRSAVADRLIGSSPCYQIDLPEKTARTLTVPTVAQVEAVASSMPERWSAAVLFAAGSGCRLGETLGLHVEQVDFLRREVRVDRQALTHTDGTVEIAPPKTKASTRTVPLGEVTVQLLAAHLARWPSETLVFPTEQGGPWRRARWTEMWRSAVKKAGVEGLRTHDLRHFYASMLIAEGLSPKVVQSRLGHATISETMDTYGHLWPEDDDRTRAAVDRILGGIAASDQVRC